MIWLIQYKGWKN